jgi:hypothetical protein
MKFEQSEDFKGYWFIENKSPEKILRLEVDVTAIKNIWFQKPFVGQTQPSFLVYPGNLGVLWFQYKMPFSLQNKYKISYVKIDNTITDEMRSKGKILKRHMKGPNTASTVR